MDTLTAEKTSKKNRVNTVDELLQKKRESAKVARPSDGFWDHTFAPRFARKMMAALSRPRSEGKALTIWGWTTPVVALVALGIAVAVAYLFSPQRAIARWEAAAKGKEYVVDALKNDSTQGKAYALDHAQNALQAENQNSAVTAYQFAPGAQAKSDF